MKRKRSWSSCSAVLMNLAARHRQIHLALVIESIARPSRSHRYYRWRHSFIINISAAASFSVCYYSRGRTRKKSRKIRRGKRRKKRLKRQRRRPQRRRKQRERRRKNRKRSFSWERMPRRHSLIAIWLYLVCARKFIATL